MAYGRRKKSSKVRGKSLINKMSKDVSPDPIIYETPTPPPAPPLAEMESNQETDYQTETPPAEEDLYNESITNESVTNESVIDEVIAPPVLSVEEQRDQERSVVNKLIRNAGRGKGSKRKKNKFTRPVQPRSEPTPPTPPEPELISVVTTLYDGANVRTFYGIKDTPIEEFVSEVLKDVPLFKINGIDDKGNVLSVYQPSQEIIRQPEGMSDVKATAGTKENDKSGNKGGKKNNKKYSIVKGDTKGGYKTQTKEQRESLTQIVEDIRYNISVDGVKGQAYPITFMGLENPDVVPQYMYEQPPIVEIPASLHESYQKSANEGVEQLKDGRRCGNCIFYD